MKRILVFFMFFAFAKAYSQEISAQTAIVDFQNIDAIIVLDTQTKKVRGSVHVTFYMLQDASEVYLDAVQMTGEKSANSNSLDIEFTENKILVKGNFMAGNTYETTFSYECRPKQALYFVHNQVWSQGQGKYTSHWLPSLDDMNDKINFDILVNDTPYPTIIGNGLTTNQVDYNGNRGGSSRMKQPISSYLVALVSGDYHVKRDTATSGVPLEYYYYPKDSLKVASTYRYSKQLFDFMEEEIGVPYPWQVYKQVPVKDFLYAGMENASCTIFSDNFIVDDIGFTDRNYVNVNAHELAHQWFGDLVTETKSDHHWLHEGFATYYALLAEREIFGDDYFYYKLYESAEQLRELSDAGKGQKLVAAGGSSLTYYQKGAWAVHILREKIGEEAFEKAVQAYLTKYAYQNVTTDDFINEVAAVSTVDLELFKKNWLYQSAFQASEALESLKKSEFVQRYFELQSGRVLPLQEKYSQLISAIESGNDYWGQEGVYQLAGELESATVPIYKKAVLSENVFIRQAVATSIQEVPEGLVLDFYTLLDDDSYVTREQAFFKLWLYLQQKGNNDAQASLLDTMDGQWGFADGNIRTLWLTLSLATPDYKPAQSLARYKELVRYTAAKEPYRLRQNAFQYLRQLDSFDKESLHNLVAASVHHVWRFRESARKLLDEQLKKPTTKSILEGMQGKFSEKEMAYLKKIELF